MVPAIEIGMGIGEAVGMELPRENGTAIGEVKIGNRHAREKGIATWETKLGMDLFDWIVLISDPATKGW